MSKRLNRWTLALATVLSGAAISNAQELTIGSKAPSLDIEHWVSKGNDKFKAVKEFETGKVYVVEFWATWCGPCIMSMPHLAETQTKYADKGVQLISVSDEDLATVEGFLKKQVKGADKDDVENTYGKLTSAYSLTTDPDQSVYKTYMEAAGQNGIPTCFIVGKSSQIEWIGHPMEMDGPLEKVVGGTWDRAAHLAEFKKQQQMDLLMAKVSKPMQKGDVKAALKILAKEREKVEGDEAAVTAIDDLEMRVNVFSAMKKLESGEVDDALAEIESISKTAKPAQKQMLAIAKCRALIAIVVDSGEKHEQAVKSLLEVTESKEIDAPTLNEFAWSIYEAASDDDKFPKATIAAAKAAAEKAVSKEPENGAILDTLAHLVHRQGNLTLAIELQTKAIKNAPAEMKEDLQAFLDQMKKEKAGK